MEGIRGFTSTGILSVKHVREVSSESLFGDYFYNIFLNFAL